MESGNKETQEVPVATPASTDAVASTNQDEKKDNQPITKRKLRVEQWHRIKAIAAENRPYGRIFNYIPLFAGSKEAAKLLADTQEFKNATNIKVNIDNPQLPVRVAVLDANKNLYLQPPRESKAIFSHVKGDATMDEAAREKFLLALNRPSGEELFFGTDVKLDMLVIGSVIVSRDGYRIGRGNGYVDLDFAILVHAGIVTPKTIIVTTVHDCQVVDTLPVELFKSYDVPLDIIVTPTEVIRVQKRLPRPKGIEWNILSERRTKLVACLQDILAHEKSLGKVVELKSEDTDIESRHRPPNQRRHRLRQRRSHKNEDGGNKERGPRENGARGGGNNEHNHRNNRGGGGGGGGGGEDRGDANKGGDRNDKNRRGKRYNKRSYDFSVRMTNIAKNVHVSDLKSELRKQKLMPRAIIWKGFSGKCYLHYDKQSVGDSSIEKLIENLQNITLSSVNEGGEIVTPQEPIKVELMPKTKPEESAGANNRIETVDVTAV